MKNLKKVIDVVFNKITKEDWDTVWVICGDEGISKSTLGLHIMEYWLTKLYGKVTPEDIKHMCSDGNSFIKDLSDLKKFEITVYDEAGELSNRRVMSEFNFRITQAYKVIRGDNLFTILILPSVFDLEPYFTKHRVRGLIYVYKRGRFAFWSKKRIRNLIGINYGFPIKNYWVSKPSYSGGYFPKYEGILLDAYKKQKEVYMQKTRGELLKLTEDKKIKLTRREIHSIKLVAWLREMGYDNKSIGDKIGLSKERISLFISEGKKQGILE